MTSSEVKAAAKENLELVRTDLSPGSFRRPRRSIPTAALGAGTLLAIAVVWFVVTNSGLVSPLYLPSPQDLVGEMRNLVINGYQRTSLAGQIGSSLFRTLSGFVLGSVLGVAVGLAAGYFKGFGGALSPILAFLRPIPPIAYIPLVVLYFGLGEAGKVFLITITAFNYTVVNAQSGAANVPIAYRRAAATLGLSRKQEFFRVILPAALPSIFTGLRVAMALSWAVVVAAELVGAQSGLGFMINNAALLLEIPVVFIGIALIGIIGLLLNLLIERAESRLVHWKGR